ncbi:hypothetical protein AUC47_14795 [Microbacterium sp. SZ1]|uniref:hypothetical protein n=1 Tax=Microbacterium sp. SZ1 TaxID=1849736 RepID=UPI000BBB8C2B|nr:hypothetical protein [Microbacterium sp. SZ1]PCE15053.1 hypothetical protein AUC47_14795 [Microbacterium sp. SZ1]
MTLPPPAAPPSRTPAGFFDARALTEPVNPAEVDAFARAHRRANPTTAGQIVAWVLAIVALLLIVPVAGVLLLGIGYAIGRDGGVLLGGLVGLLLFGGLTVGVIALVRRANRQRALTRFRLSRFAAANAMTYLDRIDAPPLPGLIFQAGSGRMSTDVLRGTAPRFVEFGNYQYTTSNGKQSQTHRWGYVAVKLDVPLPNIILDALGNNTLGRSLAAGFRRDQRLSLEGDFDRYFSLYCPEGYEVDALYLFTPDVMARFIDHAAELDVEIVDDWLFLYTKREASTLDPATWAWLFGAVGALLVKLDQWARWRDERLRAQAAPAAPSAASPPAPGAPALPFTAPATLLTPPPVGVAPPGRRLRRRSPWIIVGIVLGAVFLVTTAPFALGILVMLTSR